MNLLEERIILPVTVADCRLGKVKDCVVNLLRGGNQSLVSADVNEINCALKIISLVTISNYLSTPTGHTEDRYSVWDSFILVPEKEVKSCKRNATITVFRGVSKQNLVVTDNMSSKTPVVLDSLFVEIPPNCGLLTVTVAITG